MLRSALMTRSIKMKLQYFMDLKKNNHLMNEAGWISNAVDHPEQVFLQQY